MVRIHSKDPRFGLHQLPVTLFPRTLWVAALCCFSFYAGTIWGIAESRNAQFLFQIDDGELHVHRTSDRLRPVQQTPRRRIDETMSSFASGAVRTKKEEFTRLYDMGVPIDPPTKGREDVLILYNHETAMPLDQSVSLSAQFEDGEGIPLANAQDATANCDILRMILTESVDEFRPSEVKRQCLAIVPQYESYHIQKWMRVDADGSRLNGAFPLRQVGRFQSEKGNYYTPPDTRTMHSNWNQLWRYLNNVDEVTKKLKPIAKSVAVDNTIVVMTCNEGQAELLTNFVCSAKSRKIDLSNVLVFPTDEKAKAIAEGLGLAAFYDEKNFALVPSVAADSLGDETFVAMMHAKVICVQMITMLGYDVLFQDVDLVWYKNPLEFFHDKRKNGNNNFDIIFTDDGNHSLQHIPFAANSGCYYVHSNDQTKYFFTSLLYAGDQILMARLDQPVLANILSEHASLFGLRVKVLDRERVDFLNGYHYRHRKETMNKFLSGGTDTYIFHMNWTKNKRDKRKFFKTIGEWRVVDRCMEKTVGEVLAWSNPSSQSGIEGKGFVDQCCTPDA